MRVVPLKTVSIRFPGSPENAPPQDLRYHDVLIGVINSAAMERGLPLSEIAKSVRLINAIEDASAKKADTVALEDADWANLNRAVSEFTGWRIIHQAILDLVEDIANAPKTAPAAAPSSDA
jgi:hypothetical protein